jgi:hypothetical protein
MKKQTIAAVAFVAFTLGGFVGCVSVTREVPEATTTTTTTNRSIVAPSTTTVQRTTTY